MEKFFTNVAEGIFTGLGVGVGLFVCSYLRELKETCTILKWLKKSSKEGKWEWRTTTAISSYCNLPQDRVKYLCSHSKKISLSVSKTTDEMWGLSDEVRPK
jgi:hypothetical protein